MSLAKLRYAADLNALAAQQVGYREGMSMDGVVRLLRARFPRMGIVHPDDYEALFERERSMGLEALL